MQKKSLMLSMIVLFLIFLCIVIFNLAGLNSWYTIIAAIIGGVIMIAGAFIIRAKSNKLK